MLATWHDVLGGLHELSMCAEHVSVRSPSLGFILRLCGVFRKHDHDLTDCAGDDTVVISCMGCSHSLSAADNALAGVVVHGFDPQLWKLLHQLKT